MVGSIAIGQRLDNLLIVRVVDGWILTLHTARRTNFVFDAIHANRLANRRRTVLLGFVML